jgi:taurine dioxygenase
MSRYKSFKIERLTPAIGAEISGVDLGHLTPGLVDEVRAALLEHKVVFFREQQITREQHIDFARQFGPLKFILRHRSIKLSGKCCK